jgi:hypothetical protein
MHYTTQEYCTSSQDIVVGTGMIRGLNLSRTKRLSPKSTDLPSTQPPTQWELRSFPGDKATEA